MKNIKPTFSLVSTFAILAAATGLAHSAQASNSYVFTGFQGVCSIATAPLYDESVNTTPVASEAACGEIAAGLEGAAYFSYYARDQHCTIYTNAACETKNATATAYKLNKVTAVAAPTDNSCGSMATVATAPSTFTMKITNPRVFPTMDQIRLTHEDGTVILIEAEAYTHGENVTSYPLGTGGQLGSVMPAPSLATYELPDMTPGKYTVEFYYGAASSRPSTLSINGVVVNGASMGQVTASWSTLQWFTEGTYDFQPGQPFCRDLTYLDSTCDPITAPENGSTTFTDKGLASTQSFSCDEGHQLVGAANLACEYKGFTGEAVQFGWNQAAPTCVGSCEQPEAPENGFVALSQGTLEDSVASYSCRSGTILTGATTSTCNDGEWSEAAPTCETDPNGAETNFTSNTVCNVEQRRGQPVRRLKRIANRHASYLPSSQTFPGNKKADSTSEGMALCKDFCEPGKCCEYVEERMVSPTYGPYTGRFCLEYNTTSTKSNSSGRWATIIK